MTDHTELRDRIRRAVYERLAHGPSAPDVLDPIADAAMSVIAPELDRERALKEEAMDTDRIAIDYLRAEIDRLRAERAALWDLLKRKTRESRTWRRRANTAIADAVEQTAHDMQRCGQLRHELDEARAENERLRIEIQRLRIEPAGYMHAVTGQVIEPEDLVVITPDGPAAIADTTCHGASSCKSPVHFESCASETPGERIPDRRNTEETR